MEGEIQQLEADAPVTELWRILTGAAPGRQDSRQITLFDSVGFALEDLPALRSVRDATQGSPYVVDLDLVAEPSTPKDLYALLAVAAAGVEIA